MKQSSTQQVKSKLSEMQTSMSQMKALSHQTTTSSSSSSSSSSALTTSSTSQLKGGKTTGGLSLSPLNLIEANRLPGTSFNKQHSTNKQTQKVLNPEWQTNIMLF
jgi:flagellar capping protein FliD